MSEPYFVPERPEITSADGTTSASFLATSATVGPWDPRHMHAGPPSALLARALETLPGGPDPGLLARLTVELLAPVPVGPVVVTARWSRAGRKVALAEASLTAAGDDRPVALARGWRIRTAPDAVDVPRGGGEPAPGPGTSRELPPGWAVGYLESVHWEWVDGEFARPGPATVWTRLRGEVVAGERPSGAQRVVAVADSASGISAVADLRTTVFVNTELTVHLRREPEGERMWMRAVSALEPRGVGLASSVLGDDGGSLGTGAQSLYVAPRR